MGFLNPGAWGWAALAVVIAAFYLWHFARRRQEVATFWLWQKALARRPAWFAARFWGSLIAQVVVLLLLVAALAQPYFKAVHAARRTIVLVLDVSASMSATDVKEDGKQSRFAAMQAEAKPLVQGLRPGEQMAILSAGSLSRAVCPFTSEPQALQTAIDAVQPTDGVTRVTEAVELARRMLDGRRNPRILVLTDGCFPQAAGLASDELVQLQRFGQGGRNLAITRLAARPDPADPKLQQVLVEAASYAEQPATCTLTVALDKGATESRTLDLAPGAATQTALSILVERSGLLTARLVVDDDLAADNQARVFVTRQQRPAVLFVPAGPPAPDEPLQAALAAIGGIELQLVTQLPDPLPARAMAVLHRRVPEQLPACPTLVVTPQSSCNLWELAGTLRENAAAVKAGRWDSPLLAGVRFSDVVVEEAVKLEFKQPAERLVETASGDSLYSLLDHPEGPVLVLHVDLQTEKSDLALRTDFARLVRQAVRWLGGNADRWGAAISTEAVFVVPADTNQQAPKPQDGRSLGVSGGSTLVAVEHVGVREVPQDKDAQPLPVNLASRSESDIRSGLTVPSRPIETAAASREQPLWMLPLGLAVLFLFVEWCLFHRRIVV